MSSEPVQTEVTIGADPAGRDAGTGRGTTCDVAIVGAGLAGTLAALMLSRRGLDVMLLDLHDAPVPEFRAEQLVGPQIARLRQLDVLAPMVRESRLHPVAVNSRLGKIIDRTAVDQFGVPYHRMVEGAQASLPSAVRRIKGRVAQVETSADMQTVSLSGGPSIQARLLVLATGLSSVLPKRLGITPTVVRAGHSLALGFDVALGDPARAGLLPLIAYGEQIRDKIDYLALFPMESGLRANLFSYHERNAEWTRAFCRDPAATLQKSLPGLSGVIGRFDITSPVQVRSNDLRVALDPARDGVVLVGDAYQTPCPAAGTGIDRLLSDLTVLCETHAPAWFASPGMHRDKIAAYYDDPVKRAFDAECLRVAHYRRAVSTEFGVGWSIHRQQVLLRRKIKAILRGRFAWGPVPNPSTMAPSL